MNRSVFFALVVLALTLAACGSGQTGPQSITLDAQDIVFGTTTLEVTAGQPVILTLKNTGALEHDFSILDIPVANVSEASDEMAGHDMSNVSEELAIHVAAAPGESATIEFTPTKPGDYEFFCTTAGHKDAGMVGTLTVKAP
jgi:uncharacterized cupredoxin-like copper-binding protein